MHQHSPKVTPEWASELLCALAARAARDAGGDCETGTTSQSVAHQLEHLIGLVTRVLGGTLTNIERKIDMSSASVIQALENLTVKVSAMRSASDSMTTLLRGIAQQLRENRTDPAAIDVIAASIGEETAEMVAAVVENTPVAEEPPVDPNQPVP